MFIVAGEGFSGGRYGGLILRVNPTAKTCTQEFIDNSTGGTLTWTATTTGVTVTVDNMHGYLYVIS